VIESGTAGRLAYDLSRGTDGDGATVAVLLHGRGSHKGDLQALRPVLPDAWTLLTPQAPYPGEAWGYGPGWAWYRYLADDRLVPQTLEASLSDLDALIQGVPALVGFEPGRIVLGGFSQGGTTSVSYALTRPTALSAAFVFSGFLPDSLDVPADPPTPLFWGHGVRDPNIPLAIAERGRGRLEAAGASLAWRDYPIGHWMVPDEVHDAVAMLEALD